MKTTHKFIVLLTALCFNLCFAQLIETKLIPSDGQSGDMFGYSVASDGDFLVVGSPNAPYPYNHYGAVYVYEKTGGLWEQKTRLAASDSASLAQFGCSVSIQGNFILIGAYGDDENGSYSGAAYLFSYNQISGQWTEHTKLLASDGAVADQFGYSVSLFGDYAIVGAPFDHVISAETGSAYIFKWNDTVWVEQAKLVASNGVGTSPKFGISTSIYGDYAIIGAYSDEGLGTHPGAAYIFYFDGEDWIQQAKLNASDPELNHLFGHSVSLYEDYAVVGSSSALTSAGGSAFIFHRDGIIWTEEAMVQGSSSFTHSDFGLSVSLDGNYLVIGAPEDDTNGDHSGCAYIFRRDGTNWTEQHRLLASDGNEDDKMGWSVFIEDDQVVAGAFGQEAGGLYCGAVYVYNGFVTDLNESKYSSVEDFHLEQNYPNPFNPSTKINFQIAEFGFVTLKVYDVLGNEVAKLINNELASGEYEVEFSGHSDEGQNLSSGVYFYQLSIRGPEINSGQVMIQTKKMILLK